MKREEDIGRVVDNKLAIIDSEGISCIDNNCMKRKKLNNKRVKSHNISSLRCLIADDLDYQIDNGYLSNEKNIKMENPYDFIMKFEKKIIRTKQTIDKELFIHTTKFRKKLLKKKIKNLEQSKADDHINYFSRGKHKFSLSINVEEAYRKETVFASSVSIQNKKVFDKHFEFNNKNSNFYLNQFKRPSTIRTPKNNTVKEPIESYLSKIKDHFITDYYGEIFYNIMDELLISMKQRYNIFLKNQKILRKY